MHVVCRLGGFHTMMSFMGSIGTQSPPKSTLGNFFKLCLKIYIDF